MNKNQAPKNPHSLWENPGFRNWVSVGKPCHLVGQTMPRELRTFDIKPPHLDILMNVMRHDGISQHHLARKLLVGRSNISMLLPQMEKRRLIVRVPDPSDKRILRLSLTDAGREITLAGMAIQERLIEEIMALSSLEDCDVVGEAMRRICEHLVKMANEVGDEKRQDA